MKNIKFLLLSTIILFVNFVLVGDVHAETRKNYLDENIGSVDNMGIYNYLSDVGGMDLSGVTKIIFGDITGSDFSFDDGVSFDISYEKDQTVVANLSDNILYINFMGVLVLNRNSIDLFSGFSNITDILGMNYLDTSLVVDMKNMFRGLTNISELDLSGFNTAAVTNMSAMFYGMTNLETIYVSKYWNTSNVTMYQDMFYNNIKLKGHNDTKYNNNYNDLDYAKMDTIDSPGYLSKRLTLSSSVYRIEKNYMFIGQNILDLELIETDDEILFVDNNQLKIYYQGKLIKNLDIVSFVSSEFELLMNFNYLYIGLYNISDVTFELINGTYKIEDEKITLYYNDEVIDVYNFMSYSSDYYDLTNDYIFVGTDEFDISKISSKNVDISFYGSKMRITFSPLSGIGWVFKEYSIITLSSSKYIIYDDYIYSGINFNSSQINLTNAEYEEGERYYNIYYEGELIKSYELAYVKCNSSMSISDHKELALNVFPPQDISGVNVTYEIIDDILYIYFREELMESYHYVSLSSDYYDLSNEYIYLGSEEFDVSKINVSGAVVYVDENYVTVKSEYGFNRSFLLVYAYSDVYDLGQDYIYVVGNNKLNLDDFSAVNGKFNIKDSKLEIRWCVDGNHCYDVVKSFDILTVSSSYVDLTNDYIYITYGNTADTLVNASNNLEVKDENNKLNIYYNNLLIDSYDIVRLKNNSDYLVYENFIYTGTEEFDINNIVVTNAILELVEKENDDGLKALKIYYHDILIIEYDIATISYTKYDLSKDYIILRNEEFEITEIEFIGSTILLDSYNVEIYFNDVCLKKFELIQVLSDKYDLTNNYIFTGMESMDYTDIKVINGSMEIYSNDIYIYNKDNSQVATFGIVTLSSSIYDLTKDYIYLAGEDFRRDCMYAVSGSIHVDGEELKIYYMDELIKSYDLVKISSSKYNWYNKFIYLGLGELDIDDISVSNGTVKVENNKLNFYYKDELVDYYDLIYISSSKYDLTKEYIFVGIDELDISKIVVTNARLVYEDDRVYVGYDDWLLEQFNIIKVSSEYYDIQEDKIHIGDYDLEARKIITTNAYTEFYYEDDVYYAYIKYNGANVYRYLVEANIISITTPCARFEFLLSEHQTITIPIEFNPGSFIYDKTLTWTSSDESVAVVDSNGTVTPVGAGYALIYATTNNGKIAGTEIFVIDNISYSSSGYVGIYTGDERMIWVEPEIVDAEVLYSLDGVRYTNVIPTFVNPGRYRVYYSISKDYYNPVYGYEDIAIYGINEIDDILKIKNDVLLIKYFNPTFMDIKLKMRIFSEVTYNFLHYDKDLIPVENETIKTGDCLKIDFDVEGDSFFQYKFAVIGDLNGDGDIDSLDLATMLIHISGKKELTDEYLETAYLNGDDEIDSLDLAYLMNHIAGKEGY